jgi:ribonuclease BN (tRNA processing enzyme)
MELTFLGMGSAFNPAMRNSNAYFVSDKRFYLVDCGETTFGKIWDLPALADCDEVVVLVTHLHADHVGSLGSLISYTHYIARKRIAVVHPLDTVVQLLDLLGIDRTCYNFVKIVSGAVTRIDDRVSVKALEVEHVPDMTCFSYVIQEDSECVYFSGDAKSIPPEIVRGLEDGSISHAYQDTSNRESEHPTHASLAYLESLLPRDVRGRVHCIHLDYDYRELLRSKGFSTVTVDS